METRRRRKMSSYHRERRVYTEMMTPPKKKPFDESEFKDLVVPESAAAVFGNHVIVLKILENLNWKELLEARLVCKLFDSTANRLDRYGPAQAFAIFDRLGELGFECDPTGAHRPALVLAFANKKSFVTSYDCRNFTRFGVDCDCTWKHKMADFIDIRIAHPIDALVVVNCDIPCPLNQPRLSSIPEEFPYICEEPYVGGISFPRIPGVSIHKIKQTKNEDVLEQLKEITKHERIECILVFQPNNNDVEHAIKTHIDHVIEQQHNHPFALGGCRVYGTKVDEFNACSNTSDKTVMYIIFSIKKSAGYQSNFDAYSNLIVEGEDDPKQSIKKKIEQMAELASRREYAAAIKFTCIERLTEGRMENELIKKYLPKVPLMDAFGLGEIARNRPENEILRNRNKKRKRSDIDIFYTFSTVLVILSWGKQITDKK